jgi:hypothetical protein
MNGIRLFSCAFFFAIALSEQVVSGADPQWVTVVNNGIAVPDDSGKRNFNSYSQPSVNINGMVTFRGRSQGGSGGQPAHGVYYRDMMRVFPVKRLLDRNTVVPAPNNLDSKFIETPSFPRIDRVSNTIATRANHKPCWKYLLPDGSETRAGTTGIYSNAFGLLQASASNLGSVPGFQYFAVPGTTIKFDVFPGSPAVTNSNSIVVKGNYTDSNGISRTGAYWRNLVPTAIPLFQRPMVTLADTAITLIPGTSVKFGSVAPPSAAGNSAVFAGFDNEDNPTLGGLYMTPLGIMRPALKTLVAIGDQVPGEAMGSRFNKFGEGLSFDGRFMTFWGAWGNETKAIRLECPEDGNQELIDYCKMMYPDGYLVNVPVHQGIFVMDCLTMKISTVAKTPDDFDDFLFWNFSGHVPGSEESEEEGEAPRWRSATFAAVSSSIQGFFPVPLVAFKARSGNMMGVTYQNPIDGIYLLKSINTSPLSFQTLIETGMDGTRIDPKAVYDHDENPATPPLPLPVTAMGIERDGFRGEYLGITASMGNESDGWAGVYLTRVRTILP